MPAHKSVVLSALIVAVVALSSRAQDMKLRQEAVTLLNHAFLVSTPSLRGAYRLDSTFRATGSPGGEDEGTYRRAQASPGNFRVEVQSTAYHTVTVITNGRRAAVKSRDVTPAVERTVQRITPIFLARFDHADVIRAILNTSSNGRQARCIEFDTTYGEKSSANEICVDSQNGTVVHMRAGPETYDYSAYFPFRDALYPGHIEYEADGTRVVIEQSLKEAPGGLDPAELQAPEGAEFLPLCREYRPPVGSEMPQPKAGEGSVVTDIVIRGEVRLDGKMYDLTIDSSSRPDLNAEALSLAGHWKFTPASCEGHPNVGPAVIILHFQGR